MSGKGKSLLPPGFKKEKKLGEGMGTVVWQARHEATDEVLALKIDTEPNPTHRLRREFAILKRIDLPGVVKVAESGQHDGRDYFTMELVDGKSFTDSMANLRGKKDLIKIFLDTFQKSLVILSDLHKQGIVHIDVKPSNLLMTRKGEPVLLDFGFAEDYVLSPTAEPSGTTLDYAAPELFTGGSVSPAADIYSLGAIAFEVLKGKVPWADKPVKELIAFKLKTPPGLGKLAFDIPSGLDTLVLRMLNPDPGLRPSAAEVLSEISWLTRGEETEFSAPVMVPRLVFGGREDEMAELSRLVFEEKRVVLLSGESGMGKTRLLREMRFKAILDDRNILYIEGRGAHLSLTDHLGSALGFKGSGKVSAKPADKWSRYERVYQAIEQGGFAGVFIDAPVDLSTDESGLLGYLARGFDNKKGVILSQVPDEVHPEAAKVELVGLDEGKTTGLVSRTFGEMKDTERLSHTVFSLSKGNPRKMNELLDVLHGEGWLTWKRGWLYESKEDTGSLAARLEGWLGEGISRLDKDARMVLDMLAVAQSPLPEEVIGRIIGENAPLALQELANKSYIRSFLNLNQPHFEFANDVIEPFILCNLSKKRRKLIKQNLATELEKYAFDIFGNELKKWDISYLSLIGSLYFNIDMKTKASRYLIAAGKFYEASFNLIQATKLLNNALDCDLGSKQKRDVLNALIRTSKLDRVEELYTQLSPLIKNQPDKKLEVLLHIAERYVNGGRLDRAWIFLKRTKRRKNPLPRYLQYKKLYTYAWLNYHKGEYNEAEKLFKEALKISQSTDAPYKALFGLGVTYSEEGNLGKALETETKALKSTERADDTSEFVYITLNLVNVLSRAGKYEQALEYLDKALPKAKEINRPFLVAMVLRRYMFINSSMGRFGKAIHAGRKAVELFTKTNSYNKIADVEQQEALIFKQRGDLKRADKVYLSIWRRLRGGTNDFIKDEVKDSILGNWGSVNKALGKFHIAERMLKKSKRLCDNLNAKSKSLWLESRLCSLYIDSGDVKAARKSLNICKCQAEKYGYPTLADSLQMYEAELLLIEGENETALEILQKLISGKGQDDFKSLRPDIFMVFGKALVKSGKFEIGIASLREVYEILKSQEEFYDQGLCLIEIADAIFKHQGYSKEAVSALEEAHTIFERLGAKHQLEKVKQLREKYMTDKSDKGSKQYLVKLKQVSALIKDLRAEHLSDEEEKLGLSYQYLEGLREVSELINRRLGKENFLDELLNIVLKLSKAQRGVVFCHEDGELHPVVSEQMDDATSMDALRVSKTVIDNLRKGLDPVYTSDATADERFKGSQSILLNKIRSIMCIPLKTEDALIGTIYVDSKQTGLFDTPRITFFEALGNLLAVSIEKSAEFRRLREDLILTRQKLSFEESGIVVGSSSAMKKLCSQLEKAASTDTNILLEGETGTGKGVFARMIHERSNRSQREFCVINCGVLPENTFESELFGTKKGAYTGASADRIGLLEAANCSTVFFDEITNTSLAMQAKLLEVIEEKVIRRMGETKHRQVNLRFIFATNRDLAEEVKAGRFREDLYYRISALILKLPPLRKRRKDITEFIRFFLKKFSREFNKDITEIDEDAIGKLLAYPWPGNIRELRNVIERSVLLTPGSRITKDIIEQYLIPVADSVEGAEQDVLDVKDLSLQQAKRKFEEKLIRQVLASHKTVEEAAEALGVSRTTLWRKMSAFGIKHHAQ